MKYLYAIFAHPDDETFGPAGTLMMEADAGTEVHLISLTAGEQGMNIDDVKDLPEVRLKEWRAAAKIIGATDTHHLGFHDGQMNNESMQQATEKIIKLVTRICDQTDDDYEIEFLTNDLNGISGHIDHIVAARAACLAFYRLRENGLNMKRIRLMCIPRSTFPVKNIDWLYMEPGRTENEISEVVDASNHYDRIIEAVRAHHSQRKDGESHIKQLGKKLAINHFINLE